MIQTDQNIELLLLNIINFNSVKLSYSTSSISNTKDKQLGPYLAGLIEGDGSIYVHDEIDSKNAPQIEIAFDIKDIKLIEKIK